MVRVVLGPLFPPLWLEKREVMDLGKFVCIIGVLAKARSLHPKISEVSASIEDGRTGVRQNLNTSEVV